MNDDMTENNFAQDYNTRKEKLVLPEYGRNVQNMVDSLKGIEDKGKRSEQARAVVKVMEILNPAVHSQEDYERKLWDHLFIMAGFDLDIDAPYPVPAPETLTARPMSVPVNKKPVKATHYGRNIEGIIELIAPMEDGETKTYLIRNLAIYMRQQYLIWNKDSVADETIFADIEKLSDGRVKVPEGVQLTRIASDASFSRPGANNNNIRKNGRQNRSRQKNQRKK